MDASALSAFAIAFFVFAASPGPDNMTIVAGQSPMAHRQELSMVSARSSES